MTFHHIGNVIIPKNNPNWRQSIILFRGVGQPPTSDNLILNWYPPNSTSVWGLLMGLLMGWLYYYTIPTTNQAFWGSYLEGPGTPRGKCHLFVAGKCHSSGPRGRRSCPDVCCKRMPSTRRQLRWEVSDKMVILLGRWWFNGWFSRGYHGFSRENDMPSWEISELNGCFLWEIIHEWGFSIARLPEDRDLSREMVTQWGKMFFFQWDLSTWLIWSMCHTESCAFGWFYIICV